MSSTYHPETDGQTKMTYKRVDHYLRAMVHNHPKSWTDLFPWVEMWYNTLFHHSLGTIPFDVVHGRPLPTITPSAMGESHVDSVDQELIRR